MRLYPRITLALIFISLWTGLRAQTTGPENGALYIHGGGRFNAAEFVQLVKDHTDKPQPAIRIITTPQGLRRKKAYDDGTPFHLVTTLRERLGVTDVKELYTLSSEVANDPNFYGQIDQADAVFMSGGNQCFLTDAFLGTETLAALRRLLDRGGVIAGSSAGAQVQSSFMTRGDYKKRVILGDKVHQEGFGFVTNSAFDVHVEERQRELDLFEVFDAEKSRLQDPNLDPGQLLGIGIDQSTAIIVTKNQLRVTGPGIVRIFNPFLWQDREPFFDELTSGESFHLLERRKLSE